jgi:hypothetical protein
VVKLIDARFHMNHGDCGAAVADLKAQVGATSKRLSLITRLQ